MNNVFVDTSAWVALFDKSDDNHKEVLRGLERIKARRTQIVISDFIFSECITTARGRSGHHVAVTAGDFLMKSGIVKIIWLDEQLKRAAWDYYKRHSDKTYSFTDCTSFVLMKKMQIGKHLSFDEHFRQAGFMLFE
jgi:predicted nucleic acid-binding protein